MTGEGARDQFPSAADVLTANIALDAGGRLADGVCCRGCGYSVRGLRPGDDCPECRLPVSHSLRGEELRFASPQWVRRLYQGSLLYVIGGIATNILIVGMVAANVIATVARQPANLAGALQLTGALLGAVMAAVSVLGAWLLTTPDPASGPESGVTLRTAARVGLIAHLLSSPTQMYMSNPTSLIFVGGMAAGAVALVGWVLYFLYLGRLVLRLPAPRLARQLRLIAIGFAIFATLAGAGGLITATLLTGAGRGAVFLTVAFTTCGSSMAYFAVEVWALVLHIILAGRLRACLAASSAP